MTIRKQWILAISILLCIMTILGGCSSGGNAKRERTITVSQAVWSENSFRIDGTDWEAGESKIVPGLYGCQGVQLNDAVNTYFEQPDGTHGAAPKEIITFQGLDSCRFHIGYAFEASSGKLLRGGYTLIQDKNMHWANFRDAVVFLAQQIDALGVPAETDTEEVLKELQSADGSQKTMASIDYVKDGIRLRLAAVWNPDLSLPSTIQVMLDRIG